MSSAKYMWTVITRAAPQEESFPSGWHTVSFGEVSGYFAPSPVPVYVPPAEKKTVSVTYRPKPAKIKVHVEHIAKKTEVGMIDFLHAPLEGASVTLDGLSGITDENGTVTFEVPARPYTVSVSAQNFLPDSQSITVGLGEEVDVYFVLNRDIPKEERSWWDKFKGEVIGFAARFAGRLVYEALVEAFTGGIGVTFKLIRAATYAVVMRFLVIAPPVY